jgi:predicted ATPase
LEELDPYELKGVPEPMILYTVVAPREVEYDDSERTMPGGFATLVGRDEEIGLLLRRWEQSKEGLGQVVLISGEAGIGKSSLVAGLRSQVRQENLTRITFHCSPYTSNSALYPIITHIHRVVGWQPEDTAKTKLAKLEQALQGARLGLADTVPLLAALLSLPLPEGRYPEQALTPQQQRQETQDVLVAWLLEEAERQPVLAVWEDLHWADPSTLEVLGLFIDQAPTAAMFHVLTYRPEFEPPWPMRSHVTPLTLNRLERLQVESILTKLAQGKTLPAEVVEHIVFKTDGVPLYVEELTKMLLGSELLQVKGHQYVLTGPLQSVTIPDTLQDSLMARLDQLNRAKELAQLGAVIGREFSYAMLQTLTTMEESSLQEGLAQLVAAELLYQRGRPPRARYLFKHALIQDAAYASLLRSTRQRIHHQIAELLEAQFPEIVMTEPEVVARHYTEAGWIELAVGYWQRAGQRAIERSANVEAIAHLQQGLKLLVTRPESLERDQQELDLLTTIGPALLVTKGYGAPEVIQACSRARQLCQQMGETPAHFAVMWNLWLFYLARSEHKNAMESIMQCLKLAEQAGDEERLLASHCSIGVSWLHLGQLAASRRHLEQAIALYEPAQQRGRGFPYAGLDLGIASMGYGAWTLWLQGNVDQARQLGDQALELAQQLGHPYTLVRTLYYDTILRQFSREWQVLRQQADATIAAATEHRVGMVLAQCPIVRGLSAVMQNHGEEGLAQMHQGLDSYRATGAQFQQAHFLALLAEASMELDQLEDGLAALDEGVTHIEKTDERYYEAELHRLRGELLLRQRDKSLSGDSRRDQADIEACFHMALDVARQQEAKSLELRAAMSLSRLWQQQDKQQEARELLGTIYSQFTEGFGTADLNEAKIFLEALR